jgi:hypothetical protein
MIQAPGTFRSALLCYNLDHKRQMRPLRSRHEDRAKAPFAPGQRGMPAIRAQNGGRRLDGRDLGLP